MQARRRAGLRSFPARRPAEWACQASNRRPPCAAGCSRVRGPSGASLARSSARRTPGASDSRLLRSHQSGGSRRPCPGLGRPEHPPAATSQRSLQACIASLPYQSSLMSRLTSSRTTSLGVDQLDATKNSPPLAWGARGGAVLIPYVVKSPFAVKVFTNEDITDLYRRVRVGTRVVVLSGKQPMAVTAPLNSPKGMSSPARAVAAPASDMPTKKRKVLVEQEQESSNNSAHGEASAARDNARNDVKTEPAGFEE